MILISSLWVKDRRDTIYLDLSIRSASASLWLRPSSQFLFLCSFCFVSLCVIDSVLLLGALVYLFLLTRFCTSKTSFYLFLGAGIGGEDALFTSLCGSVLSAALCCGASSALISWTFGSSPCTSLSII